MILVSNDDGIYARGLWELVRALKEVGDVVVVVPDRGYPGQGTCVTMERSFRVRKTNPLVDDIGEVPCYSVEGTPSDCVVVGLCGLVKDRVDMVVTGINEGANVGGAILLSGTVGAALQGYLRGIPSLAIGVDGLENFNFEPGAKLAAAMARIVTAKMLPHEMLVNISLPNLPLNHIKGIAITRPSVGPFCDAVDMGQDGLNTYYWITRDYTPRQEKGTDIWALSQNRISITFLALGGNLLSPLDRTPMRWLLATLSDNLGMKAKQNSSPIYLSYDKAELLAYYGYL